MEDYGGEWLESLQEVLEQIQDGNRRDLIFHNFVVWILSSELDKLGMSHFKITGSPAKTSGLTNSLQ